jgi:hypothetical protein
MNRIALKLALTALFVLALVGWASGLDMMTCSTRALAGAAIVYVGMRTALGWILDILVRAMIQPSVEQRRRDGSQ